MSNAFRVTQRTISEGTLSNLQGNLGKMQRLQEQLSSGKQISRPSDSPTATAASMKFRSDVRRAEQYTRNGQDGLGWLGTADSTLERSSEMVGRARELLLLGANASYGPQERAAMAAEIDGLREGLLGLANAKYLDRPLFAGTQNTPNAYDPDGTYRGNDGAVNRTIGADAVVQVNVTGPEIFGEPGNDLFSLLSDISAHLKDPASTGRLGTTDLDALDARTLEIRNAQATVGARYKRVETMRTRADDDLLTLRNGLSEVEDIDLPDTVVRLQLQETAYQAALSATARVLQPSLVDFLR